MPPNEGRIIHLSLQDNPEVSSESHGYGSDRQVKINPKQHIKIFVDKQKLSNEFKIH